MLPGRERGGQLAGPLQVDPARGDAVLAEGVQVGAEAGGVGERRLVSRGDDRRELRLGAVLAAHGILLEHLAGTLERAGELRQARGRGVPVRHGEDEHGRRLVVASRPGDEADGDALAEPRLDVLGVVDALELAVLLEPLER